MCVKVSIEARSSNHYGRRKAISVTYSVCVSAASVNQHANRTRYCILSSVACSALQNFSALCHKRHDLKKYRK